MEPSSSASSSDVNATALAYLRSRGFAPAAAHPPREVKINEMLARDYGKASRYALHIAPTANTPSYEESYVKLGAWINSRPADQLRELQNLLFPMFIHCFLALLTQSQAEGNDRSAPTRFLEQHAQEHRSGSNVEKRRQVDELIKLANPDARISDSQIAKIYLSQRVSWVCSAISYESVANFLVDAKLHRLLRLLMLYFNVHAVRREPGNPPAPAAATPTTGVDAAASSGVVSAAASPTPSAAAAPAAASGTSTSTSTSGGDAATSDAASPAVSLLYPSTTLWGELQPKEAASSSSTGEPAPAPLPVESVPSDKSVPEMVGSPAPSAAAKAEADDAAKKEDGPAAAASGRTSEKKERRPCNASVCVLRFETGADPHDFSSIDVSQCLRFAACGRSDGAISLCRVSRERILESRFHTPPAMEGEEEEEAPGGAAAALVAPAPPPPMPRNKPPPQPMPLSAHSLVGHSGPVYSCALSRDSRFVLSGGQDGGVRLWSARHAQCLVSYRGHAHPVFHVSFSPHNAHFLTSCYDGALRLYTTERRAPLRVLAGHTADVNHATFHPNGAYALSASEDSTLRLWDVSTAGCIRLFHGHKGPVTCAAISPDGATAASASEDHTVKVWHLATGKMLSTLPLGSSGGNGGGGGNGNGGSGATTSLLPMEGMANPRAVCFSSSGRLLACAGERSVAIWEVRDLLRTTEGNVPLKPTLQYESPVPLMGASFLTNHAVLVAAGIESKREAPMPMAVP